MKAFAITCFLCLMLFAAGAGAGELKVIELKDGSVITGEVISLAGGLYTIKSDSLGTIKLEESKIRAIRSRSPEKGSASGGPAAAQGNDTQALQQKMMGDQEIMTMIQSLKDDPEFKKVMEDPVVMKAMREGDVSALMANPQFMKLLNNPTVKEIEKKVKP
jgi:hypothetical protein